MPAGNRTARIDTTSGRLTVTVADDLVHARGIPYATAGRFQAPVPLSSPARDRDATRRGPACPQDPSRLDTVTGPLVQGLRQDENCLVLSVTAPEDAAALPVMVWFHGGANMSGSGESSLYDPDDLVREGVVVVNVTHRLGVFGYLTARDAETQNLGLRDQIEALRWVAANISAFGGDPSLVTAFGQSAGGDSVLCLLATAETEGLIRRAIVQSAPHGLRAGREAMTQAMRDSLTSQLPTAAAELASTDQLLATQRRAISVASGYGLTGGLPFAPVHDTAPLTGDFRDGLRSVASQVDLLIGYTKHDAEPFVAMSPKAAQLDKLGPLGRALKRRIVNRVTDDIFHPREIVDLWDAAGGNVATYRIDWSPTGSSHGACHCIELPLLFSGDWSRASMLGGEDPPPALSDDLRRTWADFAKNGAHAGVSGHLRFS
jgi:para-nitrobenzyl esterase